MKSYQQKKGGVLRGLTNVWSRKTGFLPAGTIKGGTYIDHGKQDDDLEESNNVINHLQLSHAEKDEEVKSLKKTNESMGDASLRLEHLVLAKNEELKR